MSGTVKGGKKAAKTNKKRHGKNFYREIGRKGGQNGHTGGFAANPELARKVGRIGGLKSRRTGIKTGEGKSHRTYEEKKERGRLRKWIAM